MSNYANTLDAWGTLGQRLLSKLKCQYRDLLQESGRRFTPLQDPLQVDLASNRWFAGAREEGYSDWLAWVVEQLPDPESRFRVLGVNNKMDPSRLRNKKSTVKRELFVEEGHEGQTGRVDILVWYEGEVLIDIEVKVVAAHDADLSKNPGYAKSLEKYPGRPIHILLVTEADQDAYEGYTVLKWNHVCIQLRKLISQRLPSMNLMIASLILAFVGAVEQNLLGFPWHGKHLFISTDAVEHLRESLEKRNVDMNTQSHETEAMQRLLEAGVTQYLDAVIALRAFQQKIQGQARKVLVRNGKLKTLGKAMNIDIKEKDITDYVNPEISSSENDGTYAWIAVKFSTGGVAGYFGMVFERDTDGRCSFKAAASMEFGAVPLAKFVVGKCKTLSLDAYHEKHEVGLSEAISADQVDQFEEKLGELIDQWARVWTSIGGVRALSSL